MTNESLKNKHMSQCAHDTLEMSVFRYIMFGHSYKSFNDLDLPRLSNNRLKVFKHITGNVLTQLYHSYYTQYDYFHLRKS